MTKINRALVSFVLTLGLITVFLYLVMFYGRTLVLIPTILCALVLFWLFWKGVHFYLFKEN